MVRLLLPPVRKRSGPYSYSPGVHTGRTNRTYRQTDRQTQRWTDATELRDLSFVIGRVISSSSMASLVQHLASVVAVAVSRPTVLRRSGCSRCSPTASHLVLQPPLQVDTLLALFLQRTYCRPFLSHLPRYEKQSIRRLRTTDAGRTREKSTKLSKKLQQYVYTRRQNDGQRKCY